MRIAFFVTRFPVLAETFVIRQVAGLIEAGHDVTVITARWGDTSCAHETYLRSDIEGRVLALRPMRNSAAGRVVRLAAFLLRTIARPMLWSRLRVAAAAVLDGSRPTLEDIAGADSNGHLGNYDAIVAHFGPAGVRAMYLQRAGLLGGPLAVVFHGYDMSECALLRTYRQGYGDLFTHAAELLPISDLWRSRLIEWGAPAERVTVLRMGVDPERLPMMDPERLLHRPLRVLSVARLVEKKGLVHAIEGVMRAAGPIHYQLIGAGPLLDELASVAARAPPDKEIVFLGQRPEQEVIAALAEADVFLLPSVTAASGDMEGIPVALMEAMARGVLVVATRHSGIPELIVDQRSGWLVPERDSAAIAQVLSLVGGGACRPGEMRRAARAAVESGFNNAKLDRQLAEICLKMREARKS